MVYVLSAKTNLPILPAFFLFHFLTSNSASLIWKGINDLYFPPEDNEIELRDIKNGELRTIPSDFGHYAGAGKTKSDLDFINKAITDLLTN